MKKVFITLALLAFSLVSQAQLLDAGKAQRVQLPEGTTVYNAVMSPDGNFVVISDQSKISKVDLATGKVTKVAAANSAYGITISNDGSQVAYYEPSFKNQLRYVSLKSASLSDGKVTEVVKPSRRLNTGVAFAGNSINAVEKGKARTKSLDGSKATSAPVASINYGHLDITVNGKTTSIDPQGRSSYLWPSISPDGQRVVYWCSGMGCYTCKLDGSDVKRIGALRGAVWAGNDMVVGYLGHDNGEVYTDAAIIASDLNGNKQVLTDDSVIATFPSANLDGSKVAFTSDGDLYIINLKK